jgi:UDPglucose 6-dehydrogenase
MNVSIIGTGHVGLVTGACLAERGHKVLCVDSDERKIKLLRSGKMPIYEPGLEAVVLRNAKAGRLKFGGTIADAAAFGKVIFICVPTPPTPSGGADLSYIEGVSREIAAALDGYRLIVEKSTVPVRTGEHVKSVLGKYARKGSEFDVASNPEFLREGAAIEDTLRPDRIVFGVESPRAEATLRELYKPFKAPIVATDIKSAELIKHASNSFLAMKISFANMLAGVCEKSGASVTEVVRGMGMDARIGGAFLNAGLGYGGSCFPKDVAAFEVIARDLGCEFGLLRETQRVNAEARARFLKKIEEELWIVKGKTIAALGLSFKPETDDLRESVPVEVVRSLVQQGARVRVYDPKAMEKAKAVLKDVTYCGSALEAAAGADCALLLTEWDEFRTLDFRKLKKAMAHPTLLDGRNLYDPAKMRALGFAYRSVGRP